MLYWAGFESVLCATVPKINLVVLTNQVSNKIRSMSEICSVCRLIKGARQGESVLLLMYFRGKECVCRLDMGIITPPFHSPRLWMFSRGGIPQMSEETSVIDNRSRLLMTLQHSTLCANSFFSEARFPRDISGLRAPTFERSNTSSRNTF